MSQSRDEQNNIKINDKVMRRQKKKKTNDLLSIRASLAPCTSQFLCIFRERAKRALLSKPKASLAPRPSQNLGPFSTKSWRERFKKGPT